MLIRFFKTYKYRNLSLLLIGIGIAILLFQSPTFHDFLHSLKSFGYISAFIAGVLFVSTFTAAIGTVMILFLAEELNPVLLALIGAAGCVISDLIIFRYIKNDSILEELKNLIGYSNTTKISKLIHTPYFSWMLPVIGALIIASPGPDELGISLLGLSNLRIREFILISFGLNLLSMSIILGISSLIF